MLKKIFFTSARWCEVDKLHPWSINFVAENFKISYKYCLITQINTNPFSAEKATFERVKFCTCLLITQYTSYYHIDSLSLHDIFVRIEN